jgi:hypothetical protein
MHIVRGTKMADSLRGVCLAYLEWDEILRRLEDIYTVDEMVEILDLSVIDLAEAFKEQVEEILPLFEKIRGSDEMEEDE